MLTQQEQNLMLEHVLQFDGTCYELIAAMVMPDHVHLLLTPMHGWTLSRITKGIKGVSARKINLLRGDRGQVWQRESYDRIVRSPLELKRKLEYMLNNPLKKGLTDDTSTYHGWYCNYEKMSELNGVRL